LDDLLKDYLKIEISKDVRSTFGQGHVPEGDFTKEQLEYAARDVKYLIPLMNAQTAQIQKEGLGNTWILECKVLPAFADMEFAGLYLDKEGWKKLIDIHTDEAARIEAELNEMAKSVVQVDLFGGVHVNWNSTDQVLTILKNMRVKVREWDRMKKDFVDRLIYKTDDKSLNRAGDMAVVRLLKAYRSHSIRVTTFGQSYIDAVSPITGRLHLDLEQMGTETGRIANKTKKGSVNPLNIPRDKAYRHCLHGAEDELIETDDYSGCELRIWADLSGDPLLTAAYMKGVDVHCYVASMLFNTEVKKGNPLRTPAKTLNFGGRM